MTAFLWLIFKSSFWFLKFLFLAGWFFARWATWLLWSVGVPVAGLGALCGLRCRQAHADWYQVGAASTSEIFSLKVVTFHGGRSHLPLHVKELLTAEVPLLDRRTVYSHLGPTFPLGCGVPLALAMIRNRRNW